MRSRRRKPGWLFLPFSLFGWLVVIFLIAPMLVVFPVSVTPNSWVSLPHNGISFIHYIQVFSSPAWLDAIGQSLLIATFTMLCATVFGTAAAIGVWRLEAHWLIGVIRVIILLPLIVPTVVSGLGMYQVWVNFGLFDTIPGTIIAHTILATPFAFLTVSAALRQVDHRLEQASRTLGAGILRTSWFILVPAAKSGVLAGAVFSFITSWDEIVVTMFVTQRHVFTLPRMIFQDIHDNLSPSIAVVSSLMILITFIITLCILLKKSRCDPNMEELS